MAYLFPPRIPSVMTRDGEEIPVHRVYCVGKNYAAHAAEMGDAKTSGHPFFFMKPADAVFPVPFDAVTAWPFPGSTKNLHHELELVVILENAKPWGYALGLDMTRRDLQARAKECQQPWEVAKSFDASAPISPCLPAADFAPEASILTLTVNGQQRQQGATGDMLWKIPELLAQLSQYFALQTGDVIFTGTPSGVGPVLPGDHIVATATGLGSIQLRVA